MESPPHPAVSADDVARLLHREFGGEREAEAIAILSTLKQREEFRVQAAALKVSNGTLDGLRRAVELGNWDWRDLLVAAEYSASFKLHRMADDQVKKAAMQKDWDAYQAWFNRVD